MLRLFPWLMPGRLLAILIRSRSSKSAVGHKGLINRVAPARPLHLASRTSQHRITPRPKLASICRHLPSAPNPATATTPHWFASTPDAQLPISEPGFLAVDTSSNAGSYGLSRFHPSQSFRNHLTRQARRPLFVPGSAEARVAIKPARFLNRAAPRLSGAYGPLVTAPLIRLCL
jgi:hypothetical protein